MVFLCRKSIKRKNEDNNKDTINNKSTILKVLCLVSLTFQNAAYVQMYKYSRIGIEDKLYVTSTAVCISEALKLIFSCFLMITYEKSWLSIVIFARDSIFKNPLDTLNVGIPAISYVIMSNLMYIAGTHLDVFTFQIVNQLKIPATVVFALILLKVNFRKLQCISLVLLMSGVAIVQLTNIEDVAKLHPSTNHTNMKNVNVFTLNTNYTYNGNNATFISDVNHVKKFLVPNKTLGLSIAIIACVLSGFAGVYFERILKTTNPSVWARNVQLSVLSIPPALIQSSILDWREIETKGFFHGYNYVVWLVIFLQAFGGLITALSMKLADNVSKAYATAASIVVSGISSTLIFNYKFNLHFGLGATLVILAIPFYACTFKTTKIEPVKMDPEEGKECYI